MGVSGVTFRQVPSFSGAVSDLRPSKPSVSVLSVPAGDRFSGGKVRIGSRCRVSGFSDDGHLDYYRSKPRCGGKKEKSLGAMKTKKKLKLLKGLLAEDLSMVSKMGSGEETQIGLVDEVQGKLISEATELLIKQLQQVRAEEKEMKKKKKMEKTKSKHMKESSSSSSSSSESETDMVMNMSSLRSAILDNPITSSTTLVQEDHNSSSTPNTLSIVSEPTKSIEVCMGGKCKKSGAGALMEEFERVIGIENAVVGCKCMGKCKDGPNVRVARSETSNDSTRSVVNPNPLCINVGMEDVSLIVAKFLGEDEKDLGMAQAC